MPTVAVMKSVDERQRRPHGGEPDPEDIVRTIVGFWNSALTMGDQTQVLRDVHDGQLIGWRDRAQHADPQEISGSGDVKALTLCPTLLAAPGIFVQRYGGL